MIPSPKEWTIIFSKNFTSWGSFSYDLTEDALRVSVKAYETSFSERLTYNFGEITNSSAIVFLHWEKLKVPFRIEFDITKIVIDSYRKQLRGQQRFFWESWKDAAFYCLQHNLNLDEAEKWIRKSIFINENSENRSLLGYVLKANNKINKAIKVFEENILKYPDHWNAYENLGEALAEFGGKSEAITNYEKALELAPDAQKPRIVDILDNLKSN